MLIIIFNTYMVGYKCAKDKALRLAGKG